ncbi:hypothetical protein PVK06_022012 [Gossypium arboreum]|uniref:Uncharacterized protein n=1 Tax=Gossypium arboreum TaxID=29729 RepID=A0ABR0P7A4_GOSAR|nr:hypothetical protein PVK06_022012 [Gossypium arboreum]
MQVVWGKFSMVDIERRLLARSLLDPDNQQFLLLSDSCVPLHNFDYVYNYLMLTNVSFIDCFVDLGPHGTGRYSERMMPEVEKNAFRKGSQWFSMKRQHAIIVMADNLYYRKFKNYCKPHMDGRNCYSDEHYLPTFFNMIDPSGVANRSVTYVDWSEGKWHPRAFRAQDITFEFLKNLTFIEESIHFTSGPKRRGISRPCLWNSMKRPLGLFLCRFFVAIFVTPASSETDFRWSAGGDSKKRTMNQKFGAAKQPTGTPSLAWSCVVVITSLLAGASVVHNTYKPDLTLPPVEDVDEAKKKQSANAKE